MIIGYSIIAVPTGIITADLIIDAERRKKTRKCNACGHAEHDADAIFCKQCGAKMG